MIGVRIGVVGWSTSEKNYLYKRGLWAIRSTIHRIDTVTGSRPILQLPYLSVLRTLHVIADHINQQIVASFIEPASRESASPVVLVPKKDCTLIYVSTFNSFSR